MADSDNDSNTGSEAPSHASKEMRLCNTCLKEKPITQFKTNGENKDGTRRRTRKCRACITEKVNPRDDNEAIRTLKLQAITKAMGVSERAMQLISEI